MIKDGFLVLPFILVWVDSAWYFETLLTFFSSLSAWILNWVVKNVFGTFHWSTAAHFLEVVNLSQILHYPYYLSRAQIYQKHPPEEVERSAKNIDTGSLSFSWIWDNKKSARDLSPLLLKRLTSNFYFSLWVIISICLCLYLPSSEWGKIKCDGNKKHCRKSQK